MIHGSAAARTLHLSPSPNVSSGLRGKAQIMRSLVPVHSMIERPRYTCDERAPAVRQLQCIWGILLDYGCVWILWSVLYYLTEQTRHSFQVSRSKIDLG